MDTDHPDPKELAELRAVFDADGTGASAAGWAAVLAFEREHGVVLPEPYRTFTAEISDGSYTGPPEYGLLGLGALPREWGRTRPERVLREPFPLTKAWLWEDDPRPASEREPELSRVFDHGSVVLGTDGFGMNWHLVVTGPQRGHIWMITGEGAEPFDAGRGFTTGAPGFTGWVRHWAAGRPWFDGS